MPFSNAIQRAVNAKPPNLSPPWKTSETWHDANHQINYLMVRHGSRMGEPAKFFQDIKEHTALIFSMLDALCMDTCPWCPEPCCLAAEVWFDFSDLLYLHFSDHPIPPSQPKQDLKKPCRYFGSKGCCLPRMGRPWICTWYLCDSQLACLRKKDAEKQASFRHALQKVKTARNHMEEAFIRLVSE